jgi:hypothetical protein
MLGFKKKAPDKEFIHADDCKIAKADPGVKIPWSETRGGRWEAVCVCKTEYFYEPPAPRTRLDPFDPSTFPSLWGMRAPGYDGSGTAPSHLEGAGRRGGGLLASRVRWLRDLVVRPALRPRGRYRWMTRSSSGSASRRPTRSRPLVRPRVRASCGSFRGAWRRWRRWTAHRASLIGYQDR